MPRRKSTPQKAPASLEEATLLCGDVATTLAEIESLRADADAAIATIMAARDAALAPLETAMKDAFTQLRSWWAVAGDGVTGGKRKSAEIAGLVIGLRTTTPALKLPKGMKAEDVLQALYGFDDPESFIVITDRLDKQALIAALRKPDHPHLADLQKLGLSVSQRDEFFIDLARADPSPADPQTHPELEPAQ